VLLDLKMPKVDGIEVLRQIKSDPQLKMIPVVVLTSSREEQDLVNELPTGRQRLHRQTGRVPGIRRGGEAGGRFLGRGQRAAAGQRAFVAAQDTMMSRRCLR
jgi:CheY-like chemotaxis protein